MSKTKPNLRKLSSGKNELKQVMLAQRTIFFGPQTVKSMEGFLNNEILNEAN